MTHDEIFTILTGLMRDYFDDDNLILLPETSADDVEAWDSMNHVNIIVAVEQRFKIRFSTSDVEHLRNVGELVTVIEKNLQN